MFGYIIINKGNMKFKEFDVYHSYYCGLCEALKKGYGLSGQLSLTYDMTFLTLLLTSLYEPETKEYTTKCAAHPFEKHPVKRNEFSDYAADMNVLFTYYKCMDDWQDDRNVMKLGYGQLLKKGYHKLYDRYGEKVYKIDRLMQKLSQAEQKQTTDIDYMAGLFGEIMGELMTPKKDEWAENLHKLGTYLGKYIYLLDAYEDIEEDLQKHRYNPLVQKYENPDFDEEVKSILTFMMAECCKEFEKLPIIENVEILRNILYSGVWYRYEAVRQKRETNKTEGQDINHA